MPDIYTITYTAYYANPDRLGLELIRSVTATLDVINSRTGIRYGDEKIEEKAVDKINSHRLGIIMTPGYNTSGINININHSEKKITITENFISTPRDNSSTISSNTNDSNNRPPITGAIGGGRKKTKHARRNKRTMRKTSRKNRR